MQPRLTDSAGSPHTKSHSKFWPSYHCFFAFPRTSFHPHNFCNLFKPEIVQEISKNIYLSNSSYLPTY